jgi:hypothetical protein
MFHYFRMRRDEFLAHYHQRSNVESVFSAIKRKFGDALRSKTETAMRNEALAKLVCHNLRWAIAEWYTLGIDPTDWGMPVRQSGPGPEGPALLRFPGCNENHPGCNENCQSGGI